MDITEQSVSRRKFWLNRIEEIAEQKSFGAEQLEKELQAEIDSSEDFVLLDRLRLSSAIPERYAHDSREEKLYSKYTDVILAVFFRMLNCSALVISTRSDVADVEVVGDHFSLVADAKAFRLSRTAKNQKDFKVASMSGWRGDKPYALVAAPLHQLPSTSSQIYQQAVSHHVCLLTYAHLAVLLEFLNLVESADQTARLLLDVLKCFEALPPTKSAASYWSMINRTMIEAHPSMRELWIAEKQKNLTAISLFKKEGLDYWAGERERLMKLSRQEAIAMLLSTQKIDAKIETIEKAGANDRLFEIDEVSPPYTNPKVERIRRGRGVRTARY